MITKRGFFEKIFNRILALVMRKFWTKCPRCYEPFGGHEKYGKCASFLKGKQLTNYRVVCPACAKLALPSLPSCKI